MAMTVITPEVINIKFTDPVDGKVKFVVDTITGSVKDFTEAEAETHVKTMLAAARSTVKAFALVESTTAFDITNV